MKWFAAAVAVAGMALAVAVFGLARETKLDPAANTGRLPNVAPALSTEPAAPPPMRAAPQEPRPQPARGCQEDDELEESDRSGEDEPSARATRAPCGTEDESGAEDEADENEANDDEASDDEAGDDEPRGAKDDQAGDSDGSGD